MGEIQGHLDSLWVLTVQIRSNGEALDFREVGSLDENRDGELLRVATNCGVERVARGGRAEEEELSWKVIERFAKGDS